MQSSLSNASIIGGIGSILTALGIFPFGFIGIILILVALNQYSKALNNPYIYQFGSRWGIIFFASSIAFMLLTGISTISNSTFWFIVAIAIAYVSSIYAVVDLEKTLIELSIALNHKLFRTAGATIFIGTLLSPLIIPILLIFVGFIILAIAFFTAPKEVSK